MRLPNFLFDYRNNLSFAMCTLFEGHIRRNGRHGVRVSYRQHGVDTRKRRLRGRCVKRKTSYTMLWQMRKVQL